MAFFTHDGCQLHYEDYGHGTPLLLVHGLGSSTLDWESQIPVLSPLYRVIVIDLRGHGRSDKPDEHYSIAGFAEDVAALIEHLQLGTVHLVGISMGGMIGFQLGVDRPELLRSLTIVNSGPEVKPHSLRDCVEIGKRWLLSHLLSLDTIAKGLGNVRAAGSVKPNRAQAPASDAQSAAASRAEIAASPLIIGCSRFISRSLKTWWHWPGPAF